MLNIFKTMPLIIIFIASLLTVSSSLRATEIQTYLTSKGPSVIITNQVAALAQPSNIKINPIHSVNCGSAVQKFKNDRTPAAILISHNQYRLSRLSNQDCIVEDFDSAKIMFITHATQEVCTKNGNGIPTNRVATLGVVRFSPYNAITKEMNDNVLVAQFKHVLFNSSDEVLQALVNKDIDVGLLSLSVAAESIKRGAISCPYSTGSSRFQQKPLKEFTGRDSFVNNESVSFMFAVKNLTAADEKKLLESIQPLAEKLFLQSIDVTTISPSKDQISEFIKRAKSAEHLD